MMATRHGLRLTLGQSMAVIALVGILLAAAVSERLHEAPYESLSSFTDPKFLVTAAIRFAGVAVILSNLQLSRGMWLVFVGYLGPWLTGIVTGVTVTVWARHDPNLSFLKIVARVSWVVVTVLTLLFALGLAVTFREIHRRLAIGKDSR